MKQPVINAKEQFYVKRGKKYYPVNDPFAYDGLGEGAWLVTVDRGCQTIRTVLSPKFIELEAALRYLEDGLCNAMSEASKMRPRETPISEKEKKAWKVYEKTMGDDMPRYFCHASFWEVARKGCEYLKKIMEQYNCNVEKIKKDFEPKMTKKQFKNAVSYLEI